MSDSGKLSFRQEGVRKAMGAFKVGEKFKLASHARMRGDARPVQSARSARHLHRAVEAEDTIVDAA